MKNWFESLAPRERQLVLGASIVLVIGLFMQLVWGPLNEAEQNARQKVNNQQQLLTWMNEKTAEYQQMKRQDRKAVNGSLSQIVSSAARSSGISLSRMQPQGDSLNVQLDEIEFNKLVRWMADLTQNKGLTIEAIDVHAAEQSGVVRVRRLQVKK
ncbi:type II secretion system protein GspM [Gayadomonas joobiniege]|uniref:type II secretion system protein GspM n=1 Tax=Gayadomonas joobiniege TaxID=1234606 RepID=UPI00035FE904|nr:type II secretion system protein M [Gayadomonas joobiniege]